MFRFQPGEHHPWRLYGVTIYSTDTHTPHSTLHTFRSQPPTCTYTRQQREPMYLVVETMRSMVRKLRTTDRGQNSEDLDLYVFEHGEKDATSPGIFPGSVVPEQI